MFMLNVEDIVARSFLIIFDECISFSLDAKTVTLHVDVSVCKALERALSSQLK